MKLKFGLLIFASLAIFFAAHFIFKGIPKPDYINKGEPIICATKPQFANFPATFQSMPVVKPIDFSSNSRAMAIQTEILAATSSGVNFAGKYLLVEGVCGPYCQKHAVVDTLGKILDFGLQTTLGVQFRPDSSLLILNPAQNATGSGLSRNATRYYEFTNETFHYLCEDQ